MKKIKNCLICFLLFALAVVSVAAFNQTRTTANADNPAGEASLPEGATFRMTNKVYLRLNGEGGFAFEVEMNEGAKSYIDDENFDRSLYFIIMPAKYLANVGANYAETIRRDGAENSYAYNAEKSFCIYVKSTSTYKKEGSDYIYARCGVGNVKTANRELDFIGVACIEQNNGNGDFSYIYATVPVVNETTADYVRTNLYAVLNKDVLYSGTDDSAAIKSIPQYEWFGLGDYPVKVESLADYNALAAKLNGGYDYGDAIIKMTDDYAAQEGATPLENENNRLYSVTFKNGDVIFDKYYVSTGAKIYKPEIDPKKAEDDANVYTFDSWQINSVDYDFENGTVTEDITLEAKYTETKKKYTVSFDVDGGVAVPDQEVEYGTPASALSQIVTTKVGYVFDGWTFEDGSAIPENATVTGNVTVKAKWEAATDTAYVVNHYQQNVNDDDYVLADTDNCKGTTNADAAVTFKNYEGFESGVIVRQKTIAADGSTVIDVRYDRKVREYSVSAIYSESGEARIKEGVAKYEDVTALFAQHIAAQDKHVRFGATVDLSAANFDFIPSNYELDTGKGTYTVVVGAENDLSLTLYYRIKAEQTRILALRSDGATAQWMFDGDSYTDNATYYYASGKYRQDGTTEQYVLVKRSSESQVLSLELAEHDSESYNSLLRISLSYNNAVYMYDDIYNVWKDTDGTVNDKILMYNEDGSVANLTSLATNSLRKYVRFEILGITTDLKILNNPPTAGWNNGDTSTYVTLEYKNIAWRQINSDVYGSMSYSYITVRPEQTQIEVAAGSSVDIGVNVYNLTTLIAAPVLAWKSENDNIATVAEGVVTGVATGETNIVVTYVKDGVEYKASIKVSVVNSVVTANYYYDVVDNIVGTDMPIYGLPETITLSEITGVTVDGTNVEFSVKNGALYIPKVLGGYHEIVLTDNGGSASTFTLKVTQTSADGEWKAGTLQWGYGDSDTYYSVTGGALSNGKYRSDGVTEQYAYYAYAEGMNAVTFKIADYNFGDYNSLARIQLGFNGKVYTYDGETNTWKDADGNVNANIRMFRADGSNVTNLADIAKSVNGDIGELVTFVITDITTDLKIINNPPTTNHNPSDANTYVTLTNNGCTWYNL